jgi:RimJ/RimL family protein N-acetyltransferase
MEFSIQLFVRPLMVADLEDFRALRLRALKEDPAAFGAAYEESRELPASDWTKILDHSQESFILGAFSPTLIGLLGFSRRQGLKRCHKGLIWGMYVVPEARGRGVAKTLMEEALAKLRSFEGLEELILAVVTKNEVAHSLYLKMGFASYGLEERALKLNEEYLDEELFSLRLAD